MYFLGVFNAHVEKWYKTYGRQSRSNVGNITSATTEREVGLSLPPCHSDASGDDPTPLYTSTSSTLPRS